MTSPRLVPADEVGPLHLDRFLRRFYTPEKSRFLRESGEWWHRGNRNRWVLLADDSIAGYCAVIPTRIRLGSMEVDAAWWVDLIMAPEFRGQGLQRIIDQRVRSVAPLVLGFPNVAAARIHKKHGWGVREDFRVLMFPLHPTLGPSVRNRKGWEGVAVRSAAAAWKPAAWLWRRRAENWEPRAARPLYTPDPPLLAAVSRNAPPQGTATSHRNEEHFQWRYFDSPALDEYRFFGAGHGEGVEVAAVARTKRTTSGTVVRVLDIFGNLQALPLCRELVRLIVKGAVQQGAHQVTVMSTDRAIRRMLRGIGFLASSTSRFCWWSSDPNLMDIMRNSAQHWALADSDNDEP